MKGRRYMTLFAALKGGSVSLPCKVEVYLTKREDEQFVPEWGWPSMGISCRATSGHKRQVKQGAYLGNSLKHQARLKDHR